MKIHDLRFVNPEYVSLVESAISDIGPTNEVTVNYIVAEQFAQRQIDTWKLLVESERKGMNRPTAIENLTELIAVMAPFVEKPIVRAAVWSGHHLHTIYIDQLTEQTIHRSSMRSPAPTSGDDTERNQEATNNAVNPSGGLGGI